MPFRREKNLLKDGVSAKWRWSAIWAMLSWEVCNRKDASMSSTSTRELIRHKGAVAVVPLFPDHTVAVEEQYRYAVGKILIEIPAGKLDSPDEDREAAAKRELREETGLVAGKLTCLGDYYGSPAIVDERITLYLATELSEGEKSLDDDEFLSVRRIPLSDLADAILRGEIPDGKTQAALSRVMLMVERKQI